MKTEDIDILVFNSCVESGAYPSPLNYKHFPKSVCTSINNVVCHGIPDDRLLEDGDIVNVDITVSISTDNKKYIFIHYYHNDILFVLKVFYNGYHGDCSKTFLVGNVDEQGRDLVKATETCLDKAIDICKPGVHFQDIGYCIEDEAEELGYEVISSFIGHGIGCYFHGPPDIYHISM